MGFPTGRRRGVARTKDEIRTADGCEQARRNVLKQSLEVIYEEEFATLFASTQVDPQVISTIAALHDVVTAAKHQLYQTHGALTQLAEALHDLIGHVEALEAWRDSLITGDRLRSRHPYQSGRKSIVANDSD